MQSEHVSDPAEPGLRSAKRGGSTLFQKGGPNRQNYHAPTRHHRWTGRGLMVTLNQLLGSLCL